MISEINKEKTTSELSARNNTVSKTKIDNNIQKSSGKMPPAVLRSSVSLAAAARLPADRLSASIVNFARFFSIPLKPDVLAAIRRKAFTPFKQPLPAANTAHTTAASASTVKTSFAASLNQMDQSAILRVKEAFSLAAAAAESKGVELSPKGLETYALALEGELQNHHDGKHQQGKQNKNQDEQEEKQTSKTERITPGDLRKMANEYCKNNPLFDILNRLPGKNGNRWIVLPFSFSQDGKQYSVSMRILLENETCIVKMALNISIDNKQKMLFLLESSNSVCVNVFINQELQIKKQETFKRNLSEFLTIPVKNISVKYSLEPFPFEGAEQLSTEHFI